ncbi:MAG TPA: glycosyltransferase family 4 protein [bacterium]|nr:glycosyltransferase family 4 protein [bacterium]
MKNILVLTGDMIGRRMAGPAIRAFEMARVLASEHTVELSCAECDGSPLELPESMTLTAFGNEPQWAAMHRFDTVIIPASMHVDAHIEPPVLVDLYDPYILSSLPRTDKSPEKQIEELLDLKRNLQRGDFFVCASQRQRDFWLGMLAAEGRINVDQFRADPHMNHLIGLAPFGIDPAPPKHGEWTFPGNADEPWLGWGGGIWDWFDPLTLIRAVDQVNRRNVPVNLFFMGTRHPNPRMTNMAMAAQARNLADDLGLTGRSVFFGDWIPYEQRGTVLRAAHAGVSCHYPHLETRFSFRTRILDYIWARIPFICTDGDVFGELCHERSCGFALPPEDVNAWTDAIFQLVTDRELLARFQTGLDSVAADLSWETVLKSVTDFCRDPHPAPDATRVPLSVSTNQNLYMGGCETAVKPAGEILGNGLIQMIPIPESGLNRIDIKFATYGRTNTGLGFLDVHDMHRQLLVRIPFDLSALEDNQWRSFYLGPIGHIDSGRIILQITTRGTAPGNAVTVWTDPGVDSATFSVNRVRFEGSVNYRLYRCSETLTGLSTAIAGKKKRGFRLWRM